MTTARHRGGDSLLRDASATLLARPWRTLATALGVIIGVASGLFTMMLTASERGEVDRNFDSQLTPLVVIEADSDSGGGNPISPLPADVETRIADAPTALVGGEVSTWRRATPVSDSRYGEELVVPVFGVSPGGLDAAGVSVATGADPSSPAVAAAPMVWLGEDLAAELGVDLTDPWGSVILIDGRRLSVAGTTTAGTRYPALGRAVVVSSTTAASLWGPPEQARVITHIRRGAANVAAAHLLATLDPTRTRGLRDATPPDGHLTRSSVNGDVQRAGTILTAIALCFGVVSVANVLSMSVLQRRSELGLRSALGWTTTRIARLILTEAILLGLYAAALGAALGIAAGSVVVHRNDWTSIIPPAALWLPPFAGLAAGALGGVLPALRAARIPPIEALRS